MFEVYFSKTAIQQFEQHAASFAENRLECMGLLLGNYYSFQGKRWVWAEQYITAENDSSPTSVRFSRDAFSSLVQKYNSSRNNKLVVGWAHSHPGYGCFLSATDVKTQDSFFDHSLNFALVVDPSKKSSSGTPLKKVFRLSDSNPCEVSFAVVEKQ